jgi:hypothetical protein
MVSKQSAKSKYVAASSKQSSIVVSVLLEQSSRQLLQALQSSSPLKKSCAVHIEHPAFSYTHGEALFGLQPQAFFTISLNSFPEHTFPLPERNEKKSFCKLH